ncbi:ferredoxin family protein [bacterium]|nr:ferredoxin family protein [bacterium]
MPKIVIDQERCKGCGLCIEFCPKKIIVWSKSFNQRGVHPAEFTDEEKCIGCAFCAIMCPDAAIEVWR